MTLGAHQVCWVAVLHDYHKWFLQDDQTEKSCVTL